MSYIIPEVNYSTNDVHLYSKLLKTFDFDNFTCIADLSLAEEYLYDCINGENFDLEKYINDKYKYIIDFLTDIKPKIDKSNFDKMVISVYSVGLVRIPKILLNNGIIDKIINNNISPKYFDAYIDNIKEKRLLSKGYQHIDIDKFTVYYIGDIFKILFDDRGDDYAFYDDYSHTLGYFPCGKYIIYEKRLYKYHENDKFIDINNPDNIILYYRNVDDIHYDKFDIYHINDTKSVEYKCEIDYENSPVAYHRGYHIGDPKLCKLKIEDQYETEYISKK